PRTGWAPLCRLAPGGAGSGRRTRGGPRRLGGRARRGPRRGGGRVCRRGGDAAGLAFVSAETPSGPASPNVYSGRVVAIHTGAGGAEGPEIQVSGSKSTPPVSFRAFIPDPIQLPFKVGERITATIQTMVYPGGGWTDATVMDATGALRLA